MSYTKRKIIDECERTFTNKSTFYKEKIVNYRGKTSDTNEYYTEVVAEFLCNNIDEYIKGIKCITRKSSYKTIGHDGEYDSNSNREEEIIAMQIFNQSKKIGAFDFIGKIEDYQTPLKSTNEDDEVGKIDLLSCDGNIIRILELKKPDSKETMLRCVLEGFTYLKTAACKKLVENFGYDPEKVEVKACPFVFYGGAQHKEMMEDRPKLRNLMDLLDSKPYYIKKEDKYVVVES